jgi:UDP-MurNAc hydroxylase
MKLTNYGGATAILEHRGKRILFDPWLDDGIYHGSWYHYPPLEIGIEELGHLDYVYISHIHEDHCSAGTIKHINQDAEIIIMDRKPNLVLRFLNSNGFKFKAIHCISPQTPREISPGLVVDMVTADPQHELSYLIDSALVMKWDGHVIYNANDCIPYDAGLKYIKQQYGDVHLALLPYAGGSGYPACYINLTNDEKLKEAARIYEERIQSFIETVQFLDPKLAMPFADQYVVAGSRSHLNKFMAHPPGPGSVFQAMQEVGILDKLILLNSGQAVELVSGTKIPDEKFYFHSKKDREHYIQDGLLGKRYDHELIDFAPVVPIDRLLEYARARLLTVQQKQHYFPEFSYYFSVPDRKKLFRIDLSKESVEELAFDAQKEEPFLALSMNSSLFVLMLIGHVSWNIADAALFLDYERRPNQYDTKIHAYINYLRV